MIRCIAALLLITALFQNCLHPQSVDMKEYNGEWEATIHPQAFSHELTFIPKAEGKWQVKMTNNQPFYDQLISSTGQHGQVNLRLGEHLHFTGAMSDDQKVLSGFLQSMNTKFRLSLHHDGNNKYTGQWNSFYIDEIQPAKIFLWVENGEGDSYEAYPVLPDNRYRGTYAENFWKKGADIGFFDNRAGYEFRGVLKEDKILLDVYIGGGKAASLVFTQITEEWTDDWMGTSATSSVDNPSYPTARKDSWDTGSLASVAGNTTLMDRLVDSIESDAYINLHSVLIAHRGILVYENYFNGFHADLPHDQRSAAKSIGSAMIGIAIEDKLFKDVNDKLYDYLPNEYLATKDKQKAKITLAHLLTMSSGLDAIDFGVNRVGQATEDNYQRTLDWLKTVLTAPMIYEPGEECYYGSANPFLLGVALSNALDVPLETYMQNRLFGPLGIENYSIPLDRKDRPYFGGGTYLTSRDMLKFGELYRNDGIWKGQRLLSSSWIKKSFEQHTVLENARDRNNYGYLFWHRTYQVGDRKIKALEARGAGGQFIAIIHELDLVLVITSGNYRTRRGWQPERIIEQYLLPVFMK